MTSHDDRHAIRDLPARYARIADTRDFEKLRDIFTPDGSLGVYFGDPSTVAPLFRVDGVESIMQAFGALHRYERTFHFVGQQLIDELTPDTARCETYCIASHFHTKHGQPQAVVWYIRYQDQLVKRDGAWRFQSRVVQVDRSEGEDV